VFTLLLLREEVSLLLKNKLKVLQTIKSKLIFLFLNLSVSPLISELKPTEKLSHNVFSVTGKSLTGDPFKEGSINNTKCLAIRKRKGLKEVMPDFADFYDKL